MGVGGFPSSFFSTASEMVGLFAMRFVGQRKRKVSLLFCLQKGIDRASGS